MAIDNDAVGKHDDLVYFQADAGAIGTMDASVDADKDQSGAPKAKAPWAARLSLGWLAFIVLGALYTKIDGWVSDPAVPEPHKGLPIVQDILYQGPLWGTAQRVESPSGAHWFGTDVLGRDTFARVLAGSWVSLVVALTAVAFGVFVGGLIGSFAGYVRGKRETAIMSVIDVILAFPPLILLLALVSIYEKRSLFVISLVIGLLSIPAYTRIARANALALSNREFVHAAQAIGTRKRTILFREIIPNVLPALLAYALVAAAGVIVVEGTLSFLGLSVQLPTPTWGNMINEGRSEIKQTILPVLFPSLFLTFTVLSLNQVGDWLQSRSSVRSSAL